MNKKLFNNDILSDLSPIFHSAMISHYEIDLYNRNIKLCRLMLIKYRDNEYDDDQINELIILTLLYGFQYTFRQKILKDLFNMNYIITDKNHTLMLSKLAVLYELHENSSINDLRHQNLIKSYKRFGFVDYYDIIFCHIIFELKTNMNNILLVQYYKILSAKFCYSNKYVKYIYDNLL